MNFIWPLFSHNACRLVLLFRVAPFLWPLRGTDGMANGVDGGEQASKPSSAATKRKKSVSTENTEPKKRRVDKCGACGRDGHRSNSAACPKRDETRRAKEGAGRQGAHGSGQDSSSSASSASAASSSEDPDAVVDVPSDEPLDPVNLPDDARLEAVYDAHEGRGIEVDAGDDQVDVEDDESPPEASSTSKSKNKDKGKSKETKKNETDSWEEMDVPFMDEYHNSFTSFLQDAGVRSSSPVQLDASIKAKVAKSGSYDFLIWANFSNSSIRMIF